MDFLKTWGVRDNWRRWVGPLKEGGWHLKMGKKKLLGLGFFRKNSFVNPEKKNQ